MEEIKMPEQQPTLANPGGYTPPSALPKKPWYTSKTIWTTIIGGILAGIGPVSTTLGHPIVVPEYVFQLLAAAGLYSLRTATTHIQ